MLYDIPWIIPFFGVLFTIAVLPNLMPNFWHKYYIPILLGWAFSFLIPAICFIETSTLMHDMLHTLFYEYLPFIMLIASLFFITSFIDIKSRFINGTPSSNAMTLLLGSCVASIVGTTGSALLFIGPILKANAHRKYKRHVIVFFIICVCNVGGCLTPLGDPPLFLGYLMGVGFFWPLNNMFFPMVIVFAWVMPLFYLYDTYLYKKNDKNTAHIINPETFKICNFRNIFLLVALIIAIFCTESLIPSSVNFHIYSFQIQLNVVVRLALMVSLLLFSIFLNNKAFKALNKFPIYEVVVIFLCVFITIIPVLKILNYAIYNDPSLVYLSTTASSHPEIYFWVTGFLSSILDNAPTYLLFFTLAGLDGLQSASYYAEPHRVVLLAISLGAVFMGALTYIGNAPNLLCRGIAQENGVSMPNMLTYSAIVGLILFPPFLLIAFIFL